MNARMSSTKNLLVLFKQNKKKKKRHINNDNYSSSCVISGCLFIFDSFIKETKKNRRINKK